MTILKASSVPGSLVWVDDHSGAIYRFQRLTHFFVLLVSVIDLVFGGGEPSVLRSTITHRGWRVWGISLAV